MNSFTLALPYALPPAELAPDLIRALKIPALTTLLSRHHSARRVDADPSARLLPHESWLASTLGLSNTGSDQAPFAIAAMRGCGLSPDDGHWFIVQPAHVQLARTHLLLADPRQLRLSEADARALFEPAAAGFAASGKTLLYGNSELWFVRADDWRDLATASPDAAIAQNLSDWIPEGSAAREFRKLQNEIQMMWYEHATNQAREARGLAPVNALWLWGGASVAAAPAPTVALAIEDAPAWMATLAPPHSGQHTLAALFANGAADQHVVHAGLIPSAIAGDWSDWLAGWQRIEQDWCVPLLAALQQGQVRSVSVRLNHRNSTLETRTSKLALRQFWRTPTLNLLK